MRGSAKVLLLLVFFLMFFMTSTATARQVRAGDKKKTILIAGLTEKGQKAQEKLDQMSPEELKELDKKLARALTLFYDREYAKSLAIFREISSQVETMDIMFWLGQSAMKVGKTKLAVQKFKDMLSIDPSLHRVRLELATCYFQMGDHEKSRKELKTVLRAEPPEQVKVKIHKLLAAIDTMTRRAFASLRLSQSIQRDDNVSSGPEEDLISVQGGTVSLGKKEKALKDWVTVTNFYGNLLYDIGERKGFAWNTAGSFYRSHCFDYYEFDFLQGGLTAGPWWMGERSILKIPFGYSQSVYGHEHLYDTKSFNPSYEYHLTGYLSLKTYFSYEDEVYEPFDKENYDSVKRYYGISPSFYFNDRKDIITLDINHENTNARDNRYSYEAMNYSVSYFKRILKDTEFLIKYTYLEREYDTSPLFYNQDREDRRHTFYTALSRNFLDHYFLSLHYYYLENDSNADLYSYDRSIYGLSLGVKF